MKIEMEFKVNDKPKGSVTIMNAKGENPLAVVSGSGNDMIADAPTIDPAGGLLVYLQAVMGAVIEESQRQR